MEIQENEVAFPLHLAQEFLDLLEWAVQGRHESTSREIHDADVLRLERIGTPALAGRAFGIIGRTDEERLIVDEREYVFLVPDVVARSDDIGTAAVELIERLARKALATSRILAIDDDDIDPFLRTEFRGMILECAAARTADDIPYQHDSQCDLLFPLPGAADSKILPVSQAVCIQRL